jgi:hypothetical protein
MSVKTSRNNDSKGASKVAHDVLMFLTATVSVQMQLLLKKRHVKTTPLDIRSASDCPS